MDIVSSLGYIGQELFYLSPERFATITGNSICIYDSIKGPRDLIWQTENGIQTISINTTTESMAIASIKSSESIQVINYNDQTLLYNLENPTNSLIIKIQFSRNGDRIYALSDKINHQLLIWGITLGINTTRLLLSISLEYICTTLTLNPCNCDQLFLYGEDGLIYGTISEILGTFSMKKEVIKLNYDTNNYDSYDPINEREITVGNSQGLARKPDSITFAVWLPFSRLLLSTTDGDIFEVSCETKACTHLGRFISPTRVEGITEELIAQELLPTCAVISVNHVIIGTKEGVLYWYPITNPNTALSTVNLTEVHQVAFANLPISSLAVDVFYMNMIIGTTSGRLYKGYVDLVEFHNDELLHDHENNEAQEVKPPSVPSVSLEVVGGDVHDGVVLCSRNLAIGVEKLSRGSKSSLSLIVTASHKGKVRFWRQLSIVVEPMVVGGGIRRSSPREMKALFDVPIGAKSMKLLPQTQLPAVTVFDFLPVDHKFNACFMVVGTVQGNVEVWTVEAIEHDEEEVGEITEVGNVTRTMEDDEGSCLVRLECKKLFEMKIFATPIAFVTPCSHTLNDLKYISAAVGSMQDDKVFILNLMKHDKVLHRSMSTYITLDDIDRPTCSVWHEDTLYIFCKSGMIYTIDSKNLDDPNSRTKFFSGLDTITSAISTYSSNRMVLLSNSNLIYSFPVDALNKDKGDVADGEGFRSFGHSDVVITATASPNGRYFTTGCVDGSYFVWKIDADEENGGGISLANNICIHANSIVSMTFTADSSMLLSTGIDGSSFIATVDKAAVTNAQRLATGKANIFAEKSSLYVPMDASGTASEENKSAFDRLVESDKTWLQLHSEELEKNIKAQNKFKAYGIKSAKDQIAERLQMLLSQNASRSELEILDRSEFVIDTKQRNQIVEKSMSKVAEIRESYRKKNLWNELRAARIRMKCWDNYEYHSIKLLPFYRIGEHSKGYELMVTSYSLMKYSSNELEVFEKMKRLRAMEIRTQKNSNLGTVDRIPSTSYFRSSWLTSVHGCPITVSWIFNEGTRWPGGDVIENILSKENALDVAGKDGKDKDNKDKDGEKKDVNNPATEDDDEASVNSWDEEREIDENNILNLLYPPEAVRTAVQKRIQITLLKEVIRIIRKKFNERFDGLMSEKEDSIGSIASRNVRIQAILDELRQEEELYAPGLLDEEKQDSAITVTDAELKSRPYESEAAKQQRLKEEEEKRQRDLENDKEDIKGRALDEMMHGTLEVKRDMFAEASALQMPEWMINLDPVDMNESQVKEYEAYQAKLKTLQEEQAAYKKGLEQEMRKLKNEVHEICKQFDDKLEELAKLKVLVHREVLSHELYIAKLAYNMAKTEQTRLSIGKVESQIQLMRTERNDLREKISDFKNKYEEMKLTHSNLLEEEKSMDKTFRRDLQNLCNNTFDQDSLKIFTQLYRMRSYPRGGGNDQSVDNYGDDSNMDISATQNSRGRSGSTKYKNSRSTKRSHSSSQRGDHGRTKNKLRASKGINISGSGVGGKDSLGPMQLAAQALRAEENSNQYLEKDPYYTAILEKEKQKKTLEAQVPMMTQLSMELDCPEGFVVDQFSWAKLSELRTTRIEKEIEAKTLSIELADLKTKLDFLDLEESILVSSMNDMKATRELLLTELNDLNNNIDMIICLRQGQDEADKDAVVTDYSDALLIPVEILNKYNFRIKELGKEKISVLTKIKQFRRKINLIDWQAKHHGLEAKHFEEYFTDLQLFRVTRELQKILRDGTDSNQKVFSIRACVIIF